MSAAAQSHGGVLRMLVGYLTLAQVNQAEPTTDDTRTSLDHAIRTRNRANIQLLVDAGGVSAAGLDPAVVLYKGKGKGKGKGFHGW